MYWLADILVGTPSDHRQFIERAHVERAKSFHRIAHAVFRRIGNIPRAIRVLFTRYRQWRRRRTTVDVLRGLSDHTLKDIGLTRGDIRGIASVIGARNQDLTVLKFRNEFIDEVDRGEKVSVREVAKEAKEARIENNLPWAA